MIEKTTQPQCGPRPCRAPSVVLEKTVTHEERLEETYSILQTEVSPRMITF